MKIEWKDKKDSFVESATLMVNDESFVVIERYAGDENAQVYKGNLNINLSRDRVASVKLLKRHVEKKILEFFEEFKDFAS